MNRHLSVFIFSCIIFFICLGSTYNIIFPPTMLTDAPGESNCTSCHTGIPNAGPGMVTVSGPTSYIPGTTYTFTVSVLDTSQARFGFSSTFLDESDLKSGSFIITDPSFTTVRTGTVNGNSRDYMSHKSAHSKNNWHFDWTAPATGTDTLTLFIAGNAANGNAQTTGDNIYTQSYTVLPPAGMAPIAEIQVNDSTPCVGDTIIFIEQITGSANNYFWDFGVGSFPAGAFGPGPHEVVYSLTGSATVSLIAANNFGTDTTTLPISIFEIPSANAGGDNAICKGDTILLNGAASTGTSTHFQWTGQGFVDADTLAHVRVSPDSSGYFALTVQTDQCVGNIDSVFVTVKPLPQVTAIFDPATTLCLGDSIQLKASGSGAGPTYSFVWTSPDPVNILSPNDSVTLAIPTTSLSTIFLTATSDGCTGAPDTANISFFANPTPTFALAGNDTLTTQSFVTYQWFFYDSLTMVTSLILGATDQTFPFRDYEMDSTNTGFLVVQVTDSNGCTGTSDWVAIPMINNPISRFVDATQFSVYAPTGISQILISWKNATPGPATFLLFDMHGKTVLEKGIEVSPTQGNMQLSTASLSSGYYLYQVKMGKEYIAGKIILR